MLRDRLAYDELIVRHAAYFTAARFLGKGQYERLEFGTLRNAIALALTAANSDE